MGSVGFDVEQARVRVARMGLRVVALLLLTLFSAAPTQAVPLIPFDAVEQPSGFSFGFLDPASYGITTFREFSQFYRAAPSGTSEAAESLLLVDPVSFERCPRSSDDCDFDSHVFDVVWDITFNLDVLDDPSLPYELDLILVDSDPASIFDGLLVTIDYASAVLDGSALDFETASLNNGDFYFIDLVLGSMLDGETRRVGFSYHVEGELPLNTDGEPGFLFPVILPGAYATPIPEPGTVSLLGLGLAALALRRRRS
ncbi:MAG: PEP-CTERM sorting domain-containing protein [Deltaproteobacteria bacterium]|nr:PEP-CTERM sorting domain-containing protein [Deltaproteobacteria bacterium]